MAEDEEITGRTASDINTVDLSTTFKVLEWFLLLVIMMWSTSKIIQGIPPSNEIKFVSGTKPVGIWLFAILCYIIMVTVKMMANRRVVLKSEEDRKSVKGGWQVFNIFIYFLICMLAYIFCLSYLCMKVRHKPLQSGGMVDWMDKGTNVPLIDPSIQIIILVGVFLVIVNAFTNLFLYLKTKEESEKDSVARSIYQSHLVILLFIVLTMIFLIVIGQNIPFPDPSMISGVKLMNTAKGELAKWFFFLILLIIGGTLVNAGANSGFFGL